MLDGALGVIAGLECLEVLAETKTAHQRPLAVAAWTDEEGRYGSLFGSRAFCGNLDGARVVDIAAPADERLADVMTRAGSAALRPPAAKAPAGPRAAHAR